jgi:hypothetical protein
VQDDTLKKHEYELMLQKDRVLKQLSQEQQEQQR